MNKFLLITIILIFIYSFIIRIEGLDKQFSTIDDTGVAWTIINHAKNIDQNYFHNKIFDTKSQDFNSPQFIILRYLDKHYNIDFAKFNIIKYFIIPQSWTYAPLQFIFTASLLNEDLSFNEINFWGRLPSFIFSMLSFYLLFLIFGILYKSKELIPILLFAFITAISFESIVYSKHMSNYSASIFSSLLIIFTFLKIKQNKEFTFFKLFLISFVFFITIFLNYQMIFLLPGVFLYFIYDFISLKNKAKVCLRNFLTVSLTFLFLFILFVLPFLLTQSSNSLSTFTGIPNKFYYNFIFSNFTIIGQITYSFYFYIENFYNALLFLFTFQSKYQFLNNFHIFIIFIFFMYFFLKRKKSNIIIHDLKIFFLFLFFSVFIFISIGKLPLSPSRHILFLLPLILIPCVIGIFSFLSNFSIKYKKYFTIFLLTYIYYCFFLSIDFNVSQMSKRKEILNSTILYDLINKYKPRKIVLPNYFLFNKLISHEIHFLYEENHNGYTVYRTNQNEKNSIYEYMIIKASDNFYNYNDLIKKTNIKTFLSYNYNSNTHLDLFISPKVSINKARIEFINTY
jgi:hypothetical protein